MWSDVETLDDLLNFSVVANISAQVIASSGEQPISIGVSGDWGAGKSSLSKMIVKSLKESTAEIKYIFIEFDAWLYQGYDDAKLALLQKVSDRLMQEASDNETILDKVKQFGKRINWLRMGKFFAPIAGSVLVGGTVGGPIGAVVAAVGSIAKGGFAPTQENLTALEDAYSNLGPHLSGLFNEKENKSIPKEISQLREQFAEILVDLKTKLVIIVDDLDRCLPSTSISTLEAIRLLLFMPNTAFIIAADEQMIKNAVKLHFGVEEMSSDLITSYFDKLIQIPVHVPRLGTNEIKAYLILLLAENRMKDGSLDKDTYQQAKATLLAALKQAWHKEITLGVMQEAFRDKAHSLQLEIEIADQLAWILVNSDKIRGNPRLIKRFLNDLMIRRNIAKAQNISVSFDEQVKIQLFERCSSSKAYEFLLNSISEINGKVNFLKELEVSIQDGKEQIKYPDQSWDDSFVRGWLELKPHLGDTDLRPLVYLCRDRSLSMHNQDELSPEGQKIYEILNFITKFDTVLVDRIKKLGELEATRLFVRMKRSVRSKQWDLKIVNAILHIPRAFPNIGEQFCSLLREMPADKRIAPMIPQLVRDTWSSSLLTEWVKDEDTPKSTKNAIETHLKGGK